MVGMGKNWRNLINSSGPENSINGKYGKELEKLINSRPENSINGKYREELGNSINSKPVEPSFFFVVPLHLPVEPFGTVDGQALRFFERVAGGAQVEVRDTPTIFPGGMCVVAMVTQTYAVRGQAIDLCLGLLCFFLKKGSSFRTID